MYVLSRRKGQEIVVGDCRVVVIKVTPTYVKLGIVGPESTKVLRMELVKEEVKS